MPPDPDAPRPPAGTPGGDGNDSTGQERRRDRTPATGRQGARQSLNEAMAAASEANSGCVICGLLGSDLLPSPELLRLAGPHRRPTLGDITRRRRT